MNYKSLSLAALLLPFFTYGVTKEARIKELKEARYKKLVEIVALKDAVLQYENFSTPSEAFKKFYQEALIHSTNEQHKLLQPNNSNALNRESIQEALHSSNSLISADVIEAFFENKKFKHSVIHELFGIKNNKEIIKESIFLDEIGFFHKDKFISLSVVFQQILAGISIVKYDECIRELFTINNEIYHLEN